MTKNNEMDGTDKLLRDLVLREAGWHRVEGPAGSAFFPETANDEKTWEIRTLSQAQAAERDTLVPPPKPETNDIRRVVRGD